MEGPRLERALSMGLVLLAVVAVGLPLYWLNEPGRQDGAVENFDSTFVKRGAALFAPTADGGYDCAGSHASEGVGGLAPFTLTDRSEEHTSELQSLMRTSYAVFRLKKKKSNHTTINQQGITIKP